jgi:class 3 adenylate cyclase/pimeloyl-ACP methyl ester carboxylesterase
METPETLFAAGPAGQVGYQVFGQGPIDVLFTPPWCWNIEVMWEEPRIERFFQRLASFGRVIIFDKRGTGVSDPVPLGALPTIEEWADDIRVVMDAVHCERAAIIGANESVAMAIVFAASHPERATALVAIDGYACGPRKEDYPFGIPPHLLDKATEFIIGRDWVPVVAPSAADDTRFRSWLKRFTRLGAAPSALESMFRSGFFWDVRSVLPTISVPTLVVHRKGNRYLPVGHGRYLADHIPGANYKELSGDDNTFYVGNQGAILDEIRGFLTGVRGEPDIDRILATVLFTDIVSSTDQAAELGDRRWLEALDAHDRIVKDYIEHFRGRQIKTTGDGVLATFDGPARAIRCARAIGEAVSQRIGIEIRAGLHTGEVELRDDDIGGISVALAARVMAEAGASEIVVSSTVKDLVIGSGIEFADRGSHALKGVPGKWHLFSVLA